MSEDTPAVLPDARALFLERLRFVLPEWQREILDRVAASPDHYHGAAFPFTAMMAAVEATATPPASDAAVPAGEAVAYAPKGHVERYLKGRNTACWVYGSPTAEDNDVLYRAAPKVASDTCPFCTGASEYQGSPEDAFCERHLRLYRKASAA